MKTAKNIYIYLTCFALLFLSLSCLKSDRDNPTDPANIVITPPPGTANEDYDIFVNSDPDFGDDAHSGELYYEPVRTLAQAIENANPGDKIAVAAGTYNETITLAGESIYGGFKADLDWSDESRDPGANVTILQDIRTSGGSAGDPIAAILVNGSASNDTVIDGFTIKGGEGDYVSAIRIDTDSVAGYSLIINNNIINGGSGDNVSYAYGIYFYNSSSDGSTYTITIMNNSITGGDINISGDRTYGILTGSLDLGDTIDLKIFNNTIDSTGDTVLTAGTATTYGIVLGNSSALIYNNTIRAGESTGQAGTLTAYGIIIDAGVSTSICNNIIFSGGGSGNRAGIFETNNISPRPDAIDNNDIYNCVYALYWYFDSSTQWQLTETASGNFQINGGGTVLTNPTGTGNIELAADFSDADWRLSSTADALIKGGGKTLSEFSTDKDGNPRTVPWSMGAYERN